jgi:two-component system osmolarity sensor histidine kinase EnvZ
MAAELLPDEVNVSARRASIVRNVDVADRLIASFLDYVRASELPLSATVDIAAVARQLLATRARGVVAHTHELLLERLLANLVDNAMRHGRPPVTIRLSTAGDDVLLDVDDDGPGLPPDAQSRLTQAFARGDASRGTPGTGLGLAIVQQIVRRMQGDLSFERVDGTARVRVRLPASGGPADQRPPA